MHVAAIRFEVDDRIADDLTRAVIRHIAATACLADFDPARGECFGRREDVRPPAIASGTERQHVRMLDEQQQIPNPIRLFVCDELALARQRIHVRHDTEAANLDGAKIQGLFRTGENPMLRWHASPAT